jgi:uncharacterized membrane protein
MVRVVTDIDQFLTSARIWLDGAWYLWVIIAAGIGVVLAIIAVSKVKARARARVPQYRRGERV